MSDHNSDFQSHIIENAVHDYIKSNSNLNFRVKKKIFLNDKIYIYPDLISVDDTEVYEIYARYSTLNSGSKRKIASDILKMNLLEKTLGTLSRKHFVVVSKSVYDYLCGENWLAFSRKQFSINLHLIELSSELQVELIETTSKQSKPFQK